MQYSAAMPGRQRQGGRWPGQGMRWAVQSSLPQQTICFCPCRWMHSSWGFAVCCGGKARRIALGGLPGPDACCIAQQCGIELVDYYQEPLALRNAVPTAEGCIGLLLRHRTRTLAGSPVLVLGFGRVGQALAVRLAALGARVTLAARSSAQRAMPKVWA